MKRRIIRIDREKCNGCGLCAEACHEGAIEMIDGRKNMTLKKLPMGTFFDRKNAKIIESGSIIKL